MNNPSFALNSQQLDALRLFIPWLRSAPVNGQVFRLFGHAGTGKTSLARVIADNLKIPTVFCAFTGKAALRMEQAGCRGAATLHSLLYHCVEDDDGYKRWILRKKGPLSEAGLVVVDEASMVNEELARDLLSFGKPILALGDPAQLPPIEGDGIFMRQEADILLTRIERTEDGNPLLELATAAREGKSIPIGTYGDSAVIGPEALDDVDLLSYDQVIVGTNNLRRSLNSEIRALLGHASPLPEVGDKLIATRNDPEGIVRNGEQFVVTEFGGIDDDDGDGALLLDVKSLDQPQASVLKVRVPPGCFTGTQVNFRDWDDVQFMDYGYAITAHKSQGSEWDSILVVDESQIARENARRWLYTAVTRAKKRITLITAG